VAPFGTGARHCELDLLSSVSDISGRPEETGPADRSVNTTLPLKPRPDALRQRPCAANPWENGVSEQPLTDRFLQQRQLSVIFHPVEGGLAITVLVQRVYMTHLGGSIGRCYQPIGLHKLAGPGQLVLNHSSSRSLPTALSGNTNRAELAHWPKCHAGVGDPRQLPACPTDQCTRGS
jgi:hypothetical protein